MDSPANILLPQSEQPALVGECRKYPYTKNDYLTEWKKFIAELQ